ncbi:unnamed protein product [Rotaria magnacalcarata]|uniref:Uncharacterized protein n=1 Tax=Rotaria magnacalcarata TaxID=392030 RepID=A0A816EVP3_9BILA|nr:unnamed protein product [Rotaria magnacalcarata]CAF1654421.1 unnamed protein product [Rotaria magnacalcarata]CAF4495079.1 unnamed protein product [Rotaria magnacalcarata]CAF5048597.1 unnamed protein product [Rotaria magnacalcarata]
MATSLRRTDLYAILDPETNERSHADIQSVDPFMSGNLGFFLHLNNSGGFTIAKENKLITIDHQSSVSKDSTETIEKQSASDDESTVTSSASNAQVVKNLTYSLTQEIFIVHQ